MKLTKRVVDSLRPKDADYFEWDDELAGFGLRVWPSGQKVYVAQYRAAGRTRRVKLGRHGPFTVEEARRQAKVVLGDVARGGNPAEDRVTQRQSLTVNQLCERYLAAVEHGLILGKRRAPKKLSTIATDRGRIARHIKPLLGTRLVRDLSQKDVNRFIRDVTVGATAITERTDKKRGKAIVEGGAGTAARTAGLLGGILSFAVSEGIIASNPAVGVKRPAGKSRQRRLTGDEYGKLGQALSEAEAEAETLQAINGIRLLAMTGCRLGEIQKLKWAEVDQANGCFRLEDTKEGASARPVGKPAFDLLAQIKKQIKKENPSSFVLPSVRGEGPFGGLPKASKRIIARAALRDVTPHTLRHSFASVAGDLGFSESTIAALLGHAKGSVTSRYVHHLDSVLIGAADKVSTAIRDAMNSKDEARTNCVT